MPPTDRPHLRWCGSRTAALFCIALAVVWLFTLPTHARAWEHENSKVAFVEYREGVIEELRANKRPFFLLFSAEWCFWCHEFGKHTLTNEDVADYLNANYNNVFIDADIHSAAYLKYRATGLPYTVFLNPDASPHFRYSGTLYADDFLTVLKQVKTNVSQGLSVEGHDSEAFSYEPPKKLALAAIEDTEKDFNRGLLEHFDPEEQGLGKGEKAIYPRTFLHLLERSQDGAKREAHSSVHRTLERAIERIYDPVEGGFFRYAETRDWKVPHYEKMADLNAGTVLLLYRVNQALGNRRLADAADKTLHYLQTTLYDSGIGVFLSFQQADEHYYFIETLEDRKKAKSPAVIRKIFIDRLAPTISYLLQVLEHRPDKKLKKQVVSSLDFIAQQFEAAGALSRYYTVDTREWSQKGTLQDYALVANMFSNASDRFHMPRYRELAGRIADKAIEEFSDSRLGILTDPRLGHADDAEVLMEANGLIAQTLIGLNNESRYGKLVAGVIKYFSGIGTVLEERFWEAKDWEFTERYVPYLRAVNIYLTRTNLAAAK